MALIECQECSEQISDQAMMCPKCGCPLKSMKGFTQMARMVCWGYEWRSKAEIAGWPLVHIAIGRSKETGKLLVARGIIAIGQFAIGLIVIAQFGLGILFGFGQFVTGLLAIGQFAFGSLVIAQFGIGYYVLAQVGMGNFVWATNRSDPAAVEYFKNIWQKIVEMFSA